jgi:hypothetical protein
MSNVPSSASTATLPLPASSNATWSGVETTKSEPLESSMLNGSNGCAYLSFRIWSITPSNAAQRYHCGFSHASLVETHAATSGGELIAAPNSRVLQATSLQRLIFAGCQKLKRRTPLSGRLNTKTISHQPTPTPRHAHTPIPYLRRPHPCLAQRLTQWIRREMLMTGGPPKSYCNRRTVVYSSIGLGLCRGVACNGRVPIDPFERHVVR